MSSDAEQSGVEPGSVVEEPTDEPTAINAEETLEPVVDEPTEPLATHIDMSAPAADDNGAGVDTLTMGGLGLALAVAGVVRMNRKLRKD